MTVRIARNYPLLDGNKRLAWVALTVFCVLNGHHLAVGTDDAVSLMFPIASGEKNGGEVVVWLADRIESSTS